MIVLYMTPSLILTGFTSMRGTHESVFRPAYMQTWRRTDEVSNKRNMQAKHRTSRLRLSHSMCKVEKITNTWLVYYTLRVGYLNGV